MIKEPKFQKLEFINVTKINHLIKTCTSMIKYDIYDKESPYLIYVKTIGYHAYFSAN